MIANQRVLCLITARGGSKGLPGKNIRPLCGKPLVVWSIEQGLSCGEIDSVVVSTDCPEIADIARRAGAKVPFLRPAELANDTATSIDVILHALDYLKARGEDYQYLVLLEPTSPLRETTDITGALNHLVRHDDITSVVGVVKTEGAHPSYLFSIEQNKLKPMMGTHPNGLRRQDIQGDYYYLEGSVYVSTVDSLRDHKGFYHESTAPWIVDRYKAIEIDELCDFIMVESLMSARIRGEIK